MEYYYGLTHALLLSVISNDLMTLSDLECLRKIFDDTKHCAASLRQLSYLSIVRFGMLHFRCYGDL